MREIETETIYQEIEYPPKEAKWPRIQERGLEGQWKMLYKDFGPQCHLYFTLTLLMAYLVERGFQYFPL